MPGVHFHLCNTCLISYTISSGKPSVEPAKAQPTIFFAVYRIINPIRTFYTASDTGDLYIRPAQLRRPELPRRAAVVPSEPAAISFGANRSKSTNSLPLESSAIYSLYELRNPDEPSPYASAAAAAGVPHKQQISAAASHHAPTTSTLPSAMTRWPPPAARPPTTPEYPTFPSSDPRKNCSRPVPIFPSDPSSSAAARAHRRSSSPLRP